MEIEESIDFLNADILKHDIFNVSEVAIMNGEGCPTSGVNDIAVVKGDAFHAVDAQFGAESSTLHLLQLHTSRTWGILQESCRR